jgi:hypothetical protein
MAEQTVYSSPVLLAESYMTKNVATDVVSIVLHVDT